MTEARQWIDSSMTIAQQRGDSRQLEILKRIQQEYTAYLEQSHAVSLSESAVGQTVGLALRIHEKGISELPDGLYIEDVVYYKKADQNLPWVQSILKLQKNERQALMQTFGRLYSNNRETHLQWLKKESGLSVREHLHRMNYPLYDMNTDAKTVRWLRDLTFEQLASMRGMQIKSAVFLRVCLGKPESGNRRDPNYSAE